MLPGPHTVADHGVLTHPDEASRFADAHAFADVGQDGDHFLFRQAGVEQGRALAFREAGFAALAIQQAALLLAVPPSHRPISFAGLAKVGTILVLAAKRA